MDNSINKFEKELDRLLEQYLGDGELNRLNLKINPPKEGNNKINRMINDFYRNQLQIENNNYSERIKIDRSITFSEKALQPDNFYEFLLDLGQLCLSGGRLNLANEIFRKVQTQSSKTLHKAESLLGLADVFSRRANWQRSLITIEKVGSLYRELNDNSGLAKCENLLGSIYGERGNLAKAKDYFLNSLSLINPDNDLELAANLDMNLGIIDNIQGNTDDSIKHLTNALVSYNKLGNNRRIAETKHNIGMVYLESEDYESALEAFDEAIEIAKQGRFMSILCLIYLAKSQVLIAMDDIYYASEFADKALDISNSTDDKLTSADIYRVKGIIERLRKNYNDAESFLLNSLRMNASLKNEKNIAETSFELAVLYEEKNNSQSKNSYLTSALNYFKQINAFKKVKKIEDMMNIGTAQSEFVIKRLT
ncbi:MAG: tetratricopeptide repeat protein [Bacteroidetes bacterium]|nr:tetratricopeptide repeat protein [Bacteroidota bacterium]